jgi:hypothetical protein
MSDNYIGYYDDYNIVNRECGDWAAFTPCGESLITTADNEQALEFKMRDLQTAFGRGEIEGRKAQSNYIKKQLGLA